MEVNRRFSETSFQHVFLKDTERKAKVLQSEKLMTHGNSNNNSKRLNPFTALVVFFGSLHLCSLADKCETSELQCGT